MNFCRNLWQRSRNSCQKSRRFFFKTESDHRKFLKRLSIADSDSDSNNNISNRCNNSSNTNSNRNNYNNISNSTNRDINLNIDTLSATAATTSTTTILATTTTTTTSTETISATGAAFTEAAATTGRNKQNMDFKFFAGVSNLFANFFGSWRWLLGKKFQHEEPIVLCLLIGGSPGPRRNIQWHLVIKNLLKLFFREKCFYCVFIGRSIIKMELSWRSESNQSATSLIEIERWPSKKTVYG